jgi:hypothetical protein
MARKKSENLNLKIHPLTLDEFRAAAMVRDRQGESRSPITMSSLLHQTIVNTIHEVKGAYPLEFQAALEEIKQKRQEKEIQDLPQRGKKSKKPGRLIVEPRASQPEQESPAEKAGRSARPRRRKQ